MLKFFFHYFFNIKNDLILFIIVNVLTFNRFLFVFINIFSIFFAFKLNLHFIFKKFLIFLINIVIIVFIFYLLINIIIFFFFINIFIIVDIGFFIKYNVHNNLNLYLIISIDFLYLKYQFDIRRYNILFMKVLYNRL